MITTRQTAIVPAGNNGKALKALLFTQFASAFADNMILFITLAIIKAKSLPDFYIGVVQASFLLAYVVLAPFVGAFADKNAKSAVLLVGNAIKAAGILALLAGLDPAAGYAIVGIGAAVYSPAKYGILPQLAPDENALLKANARIEGYTILAILTGSVCGGLLAETSAPVALGACFLLYGLSLLITLLIPKVAGDPSIRYAKEAALFVKHTAVLFRNGKTLFTLIGTGSFWMSSAALRLAVIAWIPLHLGIDSLEQISMIVGVTGIGIMAGALATPLLVPIKRFTSSYRYGIVMVALILLFPFVPWLGAVIALLLGVGFAGGVFIVPMNAVLQDEGHRLVGAGKSIAVQNFVENALMLIAVGAYTKLSSQGFGPDSAIMAIGALLALFVVCLWLQKKKIDAAERQ